MNEPVISMSPNVSAVAKALIAAKGNMGPLIKGANNPFFKSKYADLGSVIEVSEQALLDQGIVTIQGAGGDGETITVETLLLHTSGEWIRSALSLKPAKANDPQAAGSAVTYARRYSLQAMCNLAAEDDDGNAASKAPAKAATPNQAPRTLAAVPNAIDPNSLLLRAIKAGYIPGPDKVLFKEWARTKVPGCRGLDDKTPLTPEQIKSIDSFLTLIEES